MTTTPSPGRPDDGAPSEETTARVRLAGISKRFGATAALVEVDLDVRPGEVHALVGENGAGKSTLVKILAGVHAPDAGRIEIDGQPVTIGDPIVARSLGISVVHQEPRLFPDLSVAENVFLADPPRNRYGVIDWRRMRDAARALFREFEVRIEVERRVRGLSMADQQLVELAKALSVDARILILDEPTASLSSHEVDRLFAVVRRLRDRGVAVLFVSHRLDEVFALSDRATVLRDGRHVVTARTADLATADLVRYMVGRAVSLFPRTQSTIGPVLLEVDELADGRSFHDVTFVVRAGEIVGLAGLVGAGRTEVARVLFGIEPAAAGTIRLDGRAVRFRSPSNALSAGVAYVPEDRHQDGLVLDFSIADNVSLPILVRLFPRLFLRPARERALAAEFCSRLQVRSTGVDQLAGALSGGNQQKVVIAKWLAARPRILILDEPTRGVDIGAKVEVHRIVSELAASGLGIVLISSDLPEVLAMSDRIVVLHEGRMTAALDRAEATEERVMFAATGHSVDQGGPPAGSVGLPDGG